MFEPEPYYNRQGEPISMEMWGELRSTKGYRRIGGTLLPNGLWVSTVWLGINHNFDEGPPLIFETMIFESADGGAALDDVQERYATEQEAFDGHRRIVAEWAGRPVSVDE